MNALGPVVSNTTPVIHLHRIGRLPLLHRVFGLVLIPRAVAREVAAPSVAHAVNLASFPWLTIQEVVELPHAVAQGLDPGEAEAIALAMDVHASTLVMDERKGRSRAAALGVPLKGTLAVLVLAKRMGVIPLARPVMDDLVATGFRAGPSLVEAILRQVGE